MHAALSRALSLFCVSVFLWCGLSAVSQDKWARVCPSLCISLSLSSLSLSLSPSLPLAETSDDRSSSTGMRRNASPAKLDLSNSRLVDPAQLAMLAAALLSNTTVLELRLDGNKFGSAGALHIATGTAAVRHHFRPILTIFFRQMTPHASCDVCSLGAHAYWTLYWTLYWMLYWCVRSDVHGRFTLCDCAVTVW